MKMGNTGSFRDIAVTDPATGLALVVHPAVQESTARGGRLRADFFTAASQEVASEGIGP